MTWDGDYVADEDTEDGENQVSKMVRSKIILQLGESKEIHVSPMAQFRYDCGLRSFNHLGVYFVLI